MPFRPPRPLLVPAALLPAACGGARAPTVTLAGAYFPAWLACALLGLLGAILIRILFIRIGLDDILPLRVLVYASLALAIAFALSITVFGR